MSSEPFPSAPTPQYLSCLITLHAAVYHWPADHVRLMPVLTARLQTLLLHDPRATLKALVDELDQVQQQAFFAQRQVAGKG